MIIRTIFSLEGAKEALLATIMYPPYLPTAHCTLVLYSRTVLEHSRTFSSIHFMERFHEISLQKVVWVVVVVVCCNYRVSSRSRPPEFEIEMEFHMTLETSGVDLDAPFFIQQNTGREYFYQLDKLVVGNCTSLMF